MSDTEEKLNPEEFSDQETAQEPLDDSTQAEVSAQEATPEINKVEFENFDTSEENDSELDTRRMKLLMDIMLPVSIELGRTRMYVKDILELERGSIIELDKMAGEPVDLYINNKKMAEGEVVVVDKHFGIRITQLIDPADRIKNLGKGY